MVVLLLWRRRPPRSTRTDTLIPYSTLFRSVRSSFSERADGDLRIDGDPGALRDRRQAIASGEWTWLRQVHGATVVTVAEPGQHAGAEADAAVTARSEEHTSELQSLMRISYAVFCLKKKKHTRQTQT